MEKMCERTTSKVVRFEVQPEVQEFISETLGGLEDKAEKFMRELEQKHPSMEDMHNRDKEGELIRNRHKHIMQIEILKNALDKISRGLV